MTGVLCHLAPQVLECPWILYVLQCNSDWSFSVISLSKYSSARGYSTCYSVTLTGVLCHLAPQVLECPCRLYVLQCNFDWSSLSSHSPSTSSVRGDSTCYSVPLTGVLCHLTLQVLECPWRLYVLQCNFDWSSLSSRSPSTRVPVVTLRVTV